MNYPKFLKRSVLSADEEKLLSPGDLEMRLEMKIGQGDVYTALEILGQLDRPLTPDCRLAMIRGCLANQKYAEALYLVRNLPDTAKKAAFLAVIAKHAAFADDYATARHAALLAEKLKLQGPSATD